MMDPFVCDESPARGLHICLVSSELEPVTNGGIGALVRRMLEDLARSGFRCTLLFDANAPAVRKARRRLGRAVPRAAIYGVAELTGDALPPTHAFPNTTYSRSYRIWRALECLNGRMPLDVVEFPDFEGLAFVSVKAKRLGLGSLGTTLLCIRIHGTGELADEADGRRRSEPRLRQIYRMEAYALRHADVVLSPSPAVTAAYDSKYRLARRRLHAPPPVERPGAGGGHVPPASGSPLRLLFYGRLQPLKGAEDLVRAVIACLQRHGPDALQVHLVGPDGPGRLRTSHRAELIDQIPAPFSRSFRFHGRIDRQRARELASTCDAAVLPSRMETFCLSAHELRWLGIPLLLSDIPAFRDHFYEGRDALYFDSIESLAGLLDELVHSRAKIQRLSPNPPKPEDPIEPYRNLLGTHPLPAKRAPAGQPMVSVVIPYYETHRYISETLHSVRRSDWAHWEVIIVDDGSWTTEARDCFADLERSHRGDERFTFVRQANRGLSAARNRGIEYARGSYILPLDADDLVHPAYLARAVEALERNPDLSFVSCFAGLFPDNESWRKPIDWVIPYDPEAAQLLYENGAGTAACVFRKRLFARHRYAETLPAYEDWDLQLRLALDRIFGEVLPAVLFFYRIRRNSLVQTAHARHDVILGQMIDARFPDAPEALREGLKIYVSSAALERGLWSGRGHSFAGTRSTLLRTVRRFYLRRLKAVLARHLSPYRREQIEAGVKRALAPRDGL